MDMPTPGTAAPTEVRRKQAVSDAMAMVENLAELPVREHLQRLDEAQQVLSAVLRNSSDLSQPGIPGLTPRT